MRVIKKQFDDFCYAKETKPCRTKKNLNRGDNEIIPPPPPP